MRIALVILALAAVPAAGLAQPRSPLMRGDVALSTGSLSSSDAEADRYNNWAATGFVGLSGGRYWTDHVKTEIELLWSGNARSYGSDTSFLPGSYVYVIRRLQHTVFSAGQSYQFGRNALFHPFVTAGISLARERRSIERPTQTAYFPGGRTQVVPAELRTEREMETTPYAAVGFKTYFAERGFFRSDLKFDFDSDVDRVTWKAAFGMDF
jgi:outer membrane protein with beta-barrel domain